jgi:hypothetical protein
MADLYLVYWREPDGELRGHSHAVLEEAVERARGHLALGRAGVRLLGCPGDELLFGQEERLDLLEVLGPLPAVRPGRRERLSALATRLSEGVLIPC